MTAEELLMMSDDVETYIADDALVIDPESRTILTPVNGLILGVESDKEAERVQFVCPRFVGDNIDLSELQIRTIYQNANGEKDFRISTDVSVDGDNIRFSWLLSRKVTKYKGKVKFIVCAIRTQADGTTKNEWNTTLAEGISLEGLEVDILEEEFEEPKDIVLQLLGMLDEKATEIMKEIDKYLEKLKIDNNLDVNSENAIQNKVVAKQFNRLSEEIDNTQKIFSFKKGTNLFNSDYVGSEEIDESYVPYTNGLLLGVTCYPYGILALTSEGYSVSHLIEVEYGDTVYFKFGTSQQAFKMTYVFEYDEDENFLTKSASGVYSYVISNEQTKYIRVLSNNETLTNNMQNKFTVYKSEETIYIKYLGEYISRCPINSIDLTSVGFSQNNDSKVNGMILNSVLKELEKIGGGIIYIPTGEYNISNDENYYCATSNIKIYGDGNRMTILNRYGKNPILHFAGGTGSDNHIRSITLENMTIYNRDTLYKDTLPLCVFECCNLIYIDKCEFRNNGTHLEFDECFDSKIFRTDFTLSGIHGDIDETTLTNDYINETNLSDRQMFPTILIKSKGQASKVAGELTDQTNELIFVGCRFESFYGGALLDLGGNTNSLHFTDCKFESLACNTPFIVSLGSLSACSFKGCYFYKLTYRNSIDYSEIPFILGRTFLTNTFDFRVSYGIGVDNDGNTVNPISPIFKFMKNFKYNLLMLRSVVENEDDMNDYSNVLTDYDDFKQYNTIITNGRIVCHNLS